MEQYSLVASASVSLADSDKTRPTLDTAEIKGLRFSGYSV